VIRVQRPKRAPEVLRTRAAAARDKDCAAFASGATKFAFDPTIYGHPSVKKALVRAQHQKCCFCESKVTHIASGHIEHYRPKGGVRQHAKDALETPGYFWLAYEWTNLLFCCEVCNSRFKKSLFPLADPATRARTPNDGLDAEEPMFVDPASDDPAAHIGFREEYPFAKGGSPRGEATWRALGLAREPLAELRRDHLATIKALQKVRDGARRPADRAEAAELLEKFSSDEGQWAAMVRAALEQV
jgi:uncharacterized protein (TIGR02646 family)